MTAGPNTEATQWVRARMGDALAAGTRERSALSPAHGKGQALQGRPRAVLDELTVRVGNLGNGLCWASAM